MKRSLLTAFTLCAALLGMADSVSARPISYPGGWQVMPMSDAMEQGIHINYSPSFKYSVGVLSEYMRDDEYSMHTFELNTLPWRLNNENSQANIYLKFGVGVAEDDKEAHPAMWTAFAADWEDRRYFTSYEARFINAVDIEQTAHQSARVGIAPYVAEFGSLHTWLMLQVDHHPSEQDNFEITPLVRFFKGPTLMEIGYGSNRNLLFNVTYVF